MSVDITELAIIDVISSLGEDDWHIFLAEDLPALVLTASWHQDIVASTACRFVRWVLNGKTHSLSHDFDPPWDSSGTIRTENADQKSLLMRYPTLDGWLENEYTGNSTATHTRGVGLSWDTYGDELEDMIEEGFEEVVVRLISENPHIDEDLIFYWAITPQHTLVEAFVHHIAKMTTSDAWDQYFPIIREQIEAQRQRNAIFQAKYDRLRVWWKRHFSDVESPLHKPQYDAMGIGMRLEELLQDADPEIVDVLATSSPPIATSNSVKLLIQDLAKQALE